MFKLTTSTFQQFCDVIPTAGPVLVSEAVEGWLAVDLHDDFAGFVEKKRLIKKKTKIEMQMIISQLLKMFVEKMYPGSKQLKNPVIVSIEFDENSNHSYLKLISNGGGKIYFRFDQKQ